MRKIKSEQNNNMETVNKKPNGETTIDWANLYDEQPDLAEEDPKRIIDNLLSKSKIDIEHLRKYILSQDIKPIDKKDIKVENMQQYFIDGELAYPLSEEICNQIDNVLADLTTPQTVTKVLDRDTLKLNKLMLLIKQQLESIENLHPIIKEITPQVVAKLTIKVLSQKYTKHIRTRYQNDKELNLNDIKFSTNEIAISIGNLLIETYAYKLVLYPSKNRSITKSTSMYKKVKTYKRTCDSKILKLIKEYYNQSVSNEQLEIIMSYLMLYAKKHEILKGTLLENFNKEQHETSLQKTAQKLGISLINILEISDIIENITINLSKKKTNIPHIRIKNDKLQEILTSPLSYNKPKVSKNPKPDYLVIEGNSIIDIIITTKRKSGIFQSTNQDKIIPTDTFDNIITAYNEVPHSINQQVYNDILELYKKVLTITKNRLSNPLILQFFKSIYFIDLEPIIKENHKDLGLLETLLTYGLSLNIPYLNNLKMKVKDHLSFNNIYNKITAYKFFIKGLLNDSNYFRHFAYFYIEKSPTSSGRFHSDVFFLQTQGHKLALSLIDFYTQVPLTETQYKDFILTVKDIIPEIKIPSKVESNYKEYQQQNKNLYLKQIKSMFKFQSKDQFKEYTSIGTKEEKLIWIGTHIKKAKEIWVAYNLLESYLNQTFLTTSYQKQDATSSAIQLIGLLKNDPLICKQSNITGKKYNDIYMQFVILLEKDIKQLINMNETIIKPLLDKYKNGNTNEKITYKLLTNEESWLEFIKNKKMTFEKKINHDRQILEEIKNIRHPFPNISDIKNYKALLFILKRYLIAAPQLLLLIPNEILINRNLVKKLIMTKGYNAGKKTGVESIFEYLITSLQELGKASIDKAALKRLCVILYDLLEPHVSQNLSGISSFSKIMREYIENKVDAKKLPITIESPYIKWTFSRHVITIASRNRLKVNNRKPIHFAIFKHGDADKKSMITAFASIFVHSCDAYIVHDVINNINKINIKNKVKGGPEIRYSFNQDSFTISAQHAVLLQSLVRVSYNKVHLMRKQIPELEDNVENTTNIKTTSNHFIRY